MYWGLRKNCCSRMKKQYTIYVTPFRDFIDPVGARNRHIAFVWFITVSAASLAFLVHQRV